MLTILKDHPRSPTGGHWFSDNGVKLRGENVDDLIEKIERQRASNAFPIGDPEAELALFYLKIAPFLIRTVDSPRPPLSLSDQVADKIMGVWRTHTGRFAASPDVEDRMKTCAACPKRTDYPKPGRYAHYCREALVRAQVLTCSLAVESGGLCSHFNLPCLLLARIPKPLETLELPTPCEGCWMQSP
ncbi:hypothetical protein [Thiocapsa sp. N5-Cardenillas]|uniref:hypothetical protein n=1 Tax=Thiocapsa sp. N5-Cardenillas TaxID=3137397 RepID=UPI0035AFE77A